jgi:hypothetical protein
MVGGVVEDKVEVTPVTAVSRTSLYGPPKAPMSEEELKEFV